MDVIEACKKVSTEGVQLLRLREIKDKVPQYDVKPAFTGKRRGWFYLDAFTASAILAVYNAISEENKVKAPRLPIDKFASFAFKHVSIGGAKALVESAK